jgi:hypothetical protein
VCPAWCPTHTANLISFRDIVVHSLTQRVPLEIIGQIGTHIGLRLVVVLISPSATPSLLKTQQFLNPCRS